MRRHVWCLGLLALGCSSGDGDDGKSPTPLKSYDPGITESSDGLVFATEDYEIPAGKEMFRCYAKTLTQDAVIDAYQFKSRPGLHHMVMAQVRAGGEEPDGYSECDVLFRPTWSPVFIATTADAHLNIPEGAANIIPAGTQLLIQLHLLNESKQPIKSQAAVEMTRSKLENPISAGLYVFGSTTVELPPMQPSNLEAKCTTARDVKFFAMLPHMHYLGTGLKIEAGPDDNSLTTVYEKNPYDFNNQELSAIDLVIPKGYKTRTTCSYNNTRNETITFGESSLNEMCFAIGFALDVKGAQGCFPAGKEYPHDPSAGECKDVVPNAAGVGKACTKGGGECATGLSCSADFQPGAPGICMKLGCASKAECGGGSAACCSIGLTNLCIPEACRPLTCAPQP